MPLVYICQPGNFILATLLSKFFGISEGPYGILVSLPYWCSFLQIFFLSTFTARLSAKRITLVSGWLHWIAWIILVGLLPSFPRTLPNVSASYFIGFFFVLSLLLAVNTIAWNSWIHEWTHENLRGRYFGFRNKLIQILTIFFLLAVSKVFDLLPQSISTFQLIFLFALGLRIPSLLAQGAMKVGRGFSSEVKEISVRDQIRLILKTPVFLWFIGFGVVWGFASNTFGPFYPVFMLQELKLSPSDLGTLVILTTIPLALSFPAWGALVDRFGNRPVMIVSIILIQTQNYLWCFLDSNHAWMLYPMWIWGGYTNGGFILGLFNLLLKLAPKEAKTLAIGFNLAATSVSMAAAVVIGGQLLSLGRHLGLSGLTLYHLAFLFQPSLALLGCFVLVNISEPKAAKVSAVFKVLGQPRTLIRLSGLQFWKSSN